MKPMEIISATGLVISVITGAIKLIEILWKKRLLSMTAFWILIALGLGVFWGSVARGYFTDRQNDIPNPQNQISSLQRTIDFLKGKTGKLNEQVAEYETRLGIPRDRIILFDHINYNGHHCDLTRGDDVSDLSLYGFGNSVSSIKVEGNIRATIYSGINYSGQHLLIERDTPSLMENDWNDKILSVDIKKQR